jgi:hypothetical protein
MTYKEVLFFIGKCLTISQEEKNKIIVEKALKAGKVDWDYVVTVSTAHFVFPALYCHLKNANFLNYLPEKLVNFMVYISDTNRERNIQIIEQAKEINQLLLANNITPIFLKGTGSLLDGLYNDIAERMVGDIDFLVKKEDINKTVTLLKKDSYVYSDNTEVLDANHRHYPRLVKDGTVAAIEVHHEMLDTKGNNYFNYNFVKDSITDKDNIHLLSNENQLLLNILSRQVNDNGHFIKNILLRPLYDTLLIANKTNSLNAVNKLEPLFHITNCYLAITAKFLNNPKNIIYLKDKEAKKYVKASINILNHNTQRKALIHSAKAKNAIKTILTTSNRKEYFISLLKRTIKKLKPNA